MLGQFLTQAMDIIFYLLSFIIWRNSCAAVELGTLNEGKYNGNPQLLTVVNTGLKTCARMCLYHKSCYAFNYNTKQLVCVLLRSGVNTLTSDPDSVFSYISSWTLSGDVCYPNPCNANERCIKTKAGSYYCGTDASFCRGITCQNGGTCNSEQSSFQCICPVGYSGEFCQTTQCDSGWIHHNGRCFFLSNATPTYTWSGAKSNCATLGAILAEPKTRAAIDFLSAEAMARGGTFWLGGNDISVENRWVWASTNQLIGEFDWYTGEPNNAGDEDCLNVHNNLQYHWNDASCSGAERYICEKAANI